MQKIYCYVDENGQDTKGKIFIVTIALFAQERDLLLNLCEEIERSSGKNIYKWHNTKYRLKVAYIKNILSKKQFAGVLHYSVFSNTKDYDNATISAIAKAVIYRKSHSLTKYTTMVFIDGLKRSQKHSYGAQLRKFGIPTHKVQGVERDESNALIRLADSFAGFIRDALWNNNPEFRALFEKAKREGYLIEV